MPRVQRLAGPACWLLTVQYFVVQVVVGAAWVHGYSWSGNAISDLGNTRCAEYDGRPVYSPLHALMNASFVLLGLTMLAGACLNSRSLAASRTATVGCACIGLAGTGAIVVGAFPENTVGGLHVAGAALPFVLGNLGVILLGRSIVTLPPGLRAAGAGLGVVGLIGLPLFLSGRHLGVGLGGMERVTAYPQDIWLIVTGAYLAARRIPPAVVVAPRAGD